MMKKRVFAVVLAAAILFGCMPLASAQRTINTPEEAFVMPASDPWVFQCDTTKAGVKIICNALEQLTTGKADSEVILNIMRDAPLVTGDDVLPEETRLSSTEFIQAALRGDFKSGYCALKETDKPGHYQIVFFYYNGDKVYWNPMTLGYEAETGYFYGTGGDGLLGIGFEFMASQYMIRTSAIDSWHKKVGYSVIYDMLAPMIGTYIDTMRFPFEYNGKDYMVQIWKGIYSLVSNGGEIGLYEKPSDRPIFWDCSDTLLDLDMQIYQGSKLFLDYGTQHTWWIGGFRFGGWAGLPVMAPRKLRMTGTMTFEDQGMLDAFAASFEENKSDKITGNVDGMTFTFDWQAG